VIILRSTHGKKKIYISKSNSLVAAAGEMPPRRRDRRRLRDPSPPSSDARAPPSALGLRLTLLVPLLILVLVLAALGFSGLLSHSPPHSQTLQTTAHSVYERGLVKRDVSAREILSVSTSRSYCSIELFIVIAELLGR
jgi:chitinase domain-containing protein 1